MCGVAGWIDFTKDLTRETQIIEAMTETMARRGPDGSGTWTDVHVALGHRRLSVIDPAGGAQPHEDAGAFSKSSARRHHLQRGSSTIFASCARSSRRLGINSERAVIRKYYSGPTCSGN